MNKFYTKLNIDFKPYNYSSFKGKLFYQYEGSTLAYYFVNDEFKIRQLLPKIFKDISNFELKIVQVTGIDNLPPHKDYGLDASINFYFQPGIAETCWYEEKPGVEENISHESKSRLYNLNDIILKDKFIASTNECYVFNNSQIHSVKKYDESTRQFLQLQYDLPYEEILQKLGAN